MRAFVAGHGRLFVLTGAGCSTPSGIPDYRDGQGQWKRKPPIDFQTFMGTDLARARYWARGMIGWRRFGSVKPNAAHRALARLEAEGHIALLVTQNVDGLHQAAGSRAVVDLHGRLDEVRCTRCDWTGPRKAWQDQLEAMNPAWVFLDAEDAPDGDADLDGVDFSFFTVPACPRCGGIVKPDVVFFGELVPGARTERTYAGLAESDAVLVVGSSLMVHSGFRYVQAAAREGKPVAAINLGRTRADGLLALKIRQPCDQVLAALFSQQG
ncbi:sir2 family protein [Bordetella holmesii 30539]|uniref:NAD-dependent protein deacetylase n=1 Tax=Bordetella holmesii 1058 TaxID=1247648 RepID=A0ABN0RW35_9BORD|nr:sir2 family protein [Bordetella holmesii ATCC 51541]EWM43958.1 sir2 family protein [Bordetella holmesii 41130]EWM48043.1 sir2 family protein [Bordetella holmesii 35009]EWM49025.1 sir2 family protein [Bordetella holmesii 70147]EXF87489.1 sir2 family protein [Bordetella holmesii 30539]EXX93492.1 sir2 family protein [Bordetella holmesii 1058]